jgi:hypothetical protein
MGKRERSDRPIRMCPRRRMSSSERRMLSVFVFLAFVCPVHGSSQWNENPSRRPDASRNPNEYAPERRGPSNERRPPPPRDYTARDYQRPEMEDDRQPRGNPNERRPPPPRDYQRPETDGNRQPPPPRSPLPPNQQPTPPRPPFESSSDNPIHYKFRSRTEQPDNFSKQNRRREGADDVPLTFQESLASEQGTDADGLTENPKFASARRDPATRYMATRRGKIVLILSSGTVGATVGAFIGKSFLDRPYFFAFTFFAAFVACTFLRNPYGELVKALGLALIYALKRTRRIRHQYPTYGHIKASIGAAQRRPFPPADNPWAYEPEEDDIDFRMLYSTAAMGFVGSAIGGNMPLIPTWLGALGGAGSFAFLTTTRDARGDLCRTMGMRVVSLGQEVLGINQELELLSKLGVVTGKVFDKCMILDRKHRIKDRLVTGFSWCYDKISRTASQVQNDMQAKGDYEPPVSRREPDRRDPGRDRRREPPDNRDRERRGGPPEPPRDSNRR